MNILSTWSFSPWFANTTSTWSHTVDMLAAMRASASLAKQKFGNFCVYTDTESAEWVRQILPNTNIHVHKNQHWDSLYNGFYSKLKLFTYLEQTTEFLHIDLDFLVGPQWPDLNKLDFEILGQWTEIVTDPEAADFYNWDKNYQQLTLPEELLDLDQQASALNTGCLAVRNVNFIHRYAQSIDNLCKLNLHNQHKFQNLTAPTIEQHTLGMLAKKENILCKTLISTQDSYNPINNQFIHFLGRRWKNRNLPLANSVLSKVLDSWIDEDLKKIASQLDNKKTLGISA